MDLELTIPWIVLQLEVRADGVWIGYRDHLKRSRKAPPAQPAALTPPGWTSVAVSLPPWGPALAVASMVHLPDNLLADINDAANALPNENGPHATGPVPLAVFLEIPRPFAVFAWEEVIAQILAFGFVDLNRVQLARIVTGAAARRSTFELPLRVLALGTASEQSLQPIRTHSWYANETVQQYGIAITEVKPGKAAAAVRTAPGTDIVVCDGDSATDVMRMARQAALNARPRLIIVLQQFGREHALLAAASVQQPLGTSVVWLPLSDITVPSFVEQLLLGIVHDYPVHEAVKAATRNSLPPAPPILFSTPASLNDLRMVYAMAAVVEEGANLDALNPGDVDQFLRRARKAVANTAELTDNISRPLTRTLRQAAQAAEPLRSAVATATGLEPTFFQETTGLEPAAYARAQIESARAVEPVLRNALEALASEQAALDVLGHVQERRLDAVLLRKQPTSARGFFVQPNETLAVGGRYQLRVTIGRRSQHSVVAGTPPPIDPLLPEPPDEKGHTLNIAVFPHGFQLDSPALQSVVLPPHGPSTTAQFDLTAPVKPGEARLRLAVYYDLAPGISPEGAADEDYHNNLIQSFLLHAVVELQERWIPEPFPSTGAPSPTRVELEFSRSERFADLGEFRARALAVGFNDNGDTHSIQIKRGDKVGQVDITETAMKKMLDAVRTQLEQATWNAAGSGPRFRDTLTEEQRKIEFDGQIPGLARSGADLYDLIWSNVDESMQNKLGALTDATDAIIEITRFNQNYIFPWAALYDFRIPQAIEGQPEAQVCHGFRRTDSNGETYSCRQCLSNCLHPDKGEAFCVYGFWGMRHQVEQLLHTPRQQEKPVRVVRPVREGAVRVAVGLDGGPAATLETELATRLGAPLVKALQPADDLLNGLWSNDERPAILVILGHYETRDLPAEPKGARITLPGKRWLQAAMITDRLRTEKNRKWTEPHPIVILAACESAAADLGTITSFINALGNARAAAVIGTETTIFEKLACKLGIELADAILQSKPFGAAVLAFRRSLAREYNPLGLIITPYGDADLVRA